MRRNTSRGLLGVQAECYDCPWRSEARNAMGNAARHADAHPDHTVNVEQTIGVTYNRKEQSDPVSEYEARCTYEPEHDPHKRSHYRCGESVMVMCSGKGPANR
jgi:hypothetical protein